MTRVRSLTSAVVAVAALAAPAATAAVATAAPPPDKARGLEFAGLVRSTDPHCRGLYAATGGGCTHGPDPAPPGYDVRVRRSTAAIQASTPAASSFAGTTPGTSVPPTDGTGAIVCDGDGVSGRRVQALYVVASDQVNRFAQVEGALGQYAINADARYNGSARQNGAARHIRFVTASDGAGGCVLDLKPVIIGPADDDSFGATVTAVRAQGYSRTDRKYMMWVDANVYCGIGSIYGDSQAAQTNANNGSYAEYGRSDNGCWNYAEAHELMHNLGGVQPDAPNATPGYHCSDESDQMCYDDDGSGPVVMRQICPTSMEPFFDCGDDDYFNAGTVPAGTYLASHWNTALSSFLIAPGTTTPPPPPPPATTTTESLSGAFGKNSTSATFTRTTAAGTGRIVATGVTQAKGKTTPATVSVTIGGPGGSATYSGSAIDTAATIGAGTTSWRISGASGVKWTLKITYPV